MADGPSPHLSWRELACHDATQTPYPDEWRGSRAIALGLEFERIRAALGGYPLLIDSCYRTPEWNKAVGGSPESQHLQGRAMDLRPDYTTPDELWRVVMEIATSGTSRIRGVGRYTWGVHVDLRPSMMLSTWDLRKDQQDA